MITKLEIIADQHLSIPTLESRNRDSLDFYDLAVWSIGDALAHSYRAGLEDQWKALEPNRNTLLWGHRVSTVVKELLGHGCTPQEVELALKSFGIPLPKITQRWYRQEQNYIQALDPKIVHELEDRIALYR